MSKDTDEVLDYFPDDHEGRSAFNKDDVIVLARVFNNKVEAQVAVSLLRTRNIPHFLSDTNATLFTENVLGGERLFIRKDDMDLVAEILKEVAQTPYEGEEDWYEEVRTKQGYKPYKNITFLLLFALVVVFIFAILIIITIR